MSNFLSWFKTELSHGFSADLRVWLGLIGVLFIVAVLIYNRRQERRVRGQFEPPAKRVEDPLDAAVSTQRQEPGFRTASGTATESAGTSASTFQNLPVVEIDESIHALILLTTEHPVTGERILAELQGFRHAGKQSVICAAAPLESSDAVNASWVAIQPGERYETVVVAVQLANRSGPLNEIEYSQFVTALQQAAEQIPASCDAPDMMETVARARQIDGRCAPLDAQIGINLACTQGNWGGEQVDGLARQQGLILRADGRYHALAEAGGNTVSLFSLQNAEGNAVAGFRADNLKTLTTARLTLLLDVPRAPRASQPYGQMKSVAMAMADALQGAIVDDDLRALTPALLDRIETEIEPVYVRLEAEGMPAGSARALALFS